MCEINRRVKNNTFICIFIKESIDVSPEGRHQQHDDHGEVVELVSFAIKGVFVMFIAYGDFYDHLAFPSLHKKRAILLVLFLFPRDEWRQGRSSVNIHRVLAHLGGRGVGRWVQAGAVWHGRTWHEGAWLAVGKTL